MPTFGLEEEVFITEPLRPTMRSLLYLARLLRRNPRWYYTHSAHNFARGADVKSGLMSGIEISTGIHNNTEGLIADWLQRRRELAEVVDSGLIVPMGHLLETLTPSNVCGLQVHVGGLRDFNQAYTNLVRYLPILILLTANSPGCDGVRYGQSMRGLRGYATGPIRDDRLYRFQDIIYSRRLGTIEIRVFDPVSDVHRVELLVKLIESIVEMDNVPRQDIEEYNALRVSVMRDGFGPQTRALYEELAARVPYEVNESLFQETASDNAWRQYESDGPLAVYKALDRAFRAGTEMTADVKSPGRLARLYGGTAGIAGYFLPRLPYYVYKGIAEWRKRPSASLEEAEKF